MDKSSIDNKSSVYYGFQGRLTEKFPSQIIVDATEVCNLGCVHCPHPEFKKSEHYSGSHLPEELNAKMVDEVKEHGQGHTQYIRYTSNGEPLIHPKIFNMVDYAVKNSGVFVTVTTNGKILNEDRVEKLLSTGVHMVDISIDAFKPETYAAIRVGGNLSVTRANVENLLKRKIESKSNTKVIVSFVEQPQNRNEILDFEKYWREKGADYVVIRRLHSAAGGVQNIANQLRTGPVEERRPCLYPWERILLNSRGELAFCPQDWVHGSAFVDYRQTTIFETWKGEFYQSLRRAHLENNYTNHKFCEQCPDWQQTRWPGVGRSYADMVEEFQAREL